MAEERHKLAFISDTHLGGPDLEAKNLFPNFLSRFTSEEAIHILEQSCQANHEALTRVLNDIDEEGHETLIHLGDVTSGWQERGITRQMESTARAARALLENDRRKVFYALGNHDLGYRHGVEGSGLNPEALNRCIGIFGDNGHLWWNFKAGEMNVLGVCSSLLSDEAREVDLGIDQKIQREFVGDILSSTSHRKDPWILCAHDPATPKLLSQEIQPHVDGLQAFVFGDYHSPATGSFLIKAQRTLATLLSPISHENAVWRKALAKAAFCPSTAPLWWQGYGWAEGEVEEGQFNFKQQFTPRPKNPPTAPFGSLAASLWAMIPPLRRRKALPEAK